MYELTIQNGSTFYQPSIEDGINWQTDRKGSPGQLTFTVIDDEILKITEGNLVWLKKNDENVFYGFIFTRKRSKEKKWDITAYDQLRYFKNKDTYIYTNKTASEFLIMLIADFKLQAGTIEDTKFKIATRTEDNTTLMDMMGNALDSTIMNSKEIFVLYDDFGKLSLKNISSMIVPILIDEETAQDFNYTSSIDGEVYNKIKLMFDNEKSGLRDVYVAQDGTNINAWGILQYCDKLKEGENGKAKADALLSLYNKKTRSLSIEDAFGDTRVRAGCMISVVLDLGDIKIQNLMLVEKCKHTFKDNLHTMSLNLRGNEITV